MTFKTQQLLIKAINKKIKKKILMIMGEQDLHQIFYSQKLNREPHKSILQEVKREKASVSVYL
jgi:hypothetical protein